MSMVERAIEKLRRNAEQQRPKPEAPAVGALVVDPLRGRRARKPGRGRHPCGAGTSARCDGPLSLSRPRFAMILEGLLAQGLVSLAMSDRNAEQHCREESPTHKALKTALDKTMLELTAFARQTASEGHNVLSKMLDAEH